MTYFTPRGKKTADERLAVNLKAGRNLDTPTPHSAAVEKMYADCRLSLLFLTT